MIEEVAEEETDKIEVEVEVEDQEHLEQKEAAEEHRQKEEYLFPIFLLKWNGRKLKTCFGKSWF